MKFIQIGLLLFLTSVFSQKHQDLYILYNNENLKNRVVSNEQTEIFQFSIQEKNPIEYVLGFDKSGKIEVQTLLPAKPTAIFTFRYSNQNGENPAKKVSGKEIKNVIDFTEITYLTDAANLYKTLKLFENIYFINTENQSTEYIAKKVKFERNAGM